VRTSYPETSWPRYRRRGGSTWPMGSGRCLSRCCRPVLGGVDRW